MKIKDFREPVVHHFGDIEPGTVFAEEETFFYMAIVPIAKPNSDAKINAVNLETGELCHFFDTDTIQLVEAELHVK